METFETASLKERLILVGVDNECGLMSVESCLDELEQLAETSGAIVLDRLIQKRERAHPGHYVGKGKLEELKDLVGLHNATGIICDDELSSTQIRNMEQALEVKILDRTMVILDIFAKNAHSAEGIAQVELAQLNYRLSHLSGMGKALSRLGAGIGTRGPGEKKLETDRRHIRNRIAELNSQLREIETQRQVLRSKRQRKASFIISIVGYTNAGKSSLLNLLTGAEVLAEDKLFATLDTTTKRLTLPGGSDILLTDTVGFIQKLPHNLVKAFRATLEELSFADILVHVVDAANPSREEQMEVVYSTLKELGCNEKPVITVFNKMDLVVECPSPGDSRSVCTHMVSAKTGEGIQTLLLSLEEEMSKSRQRISVLVPYDKGSYLDIIYGSGEILREEHLEGGTYIELYADSRLFAILHNFSTKKRD